MLYLMDVLPKKVFEKQFPSPLDKPLELEFTLIEEGTYLLVVSARACAWWQRLPPTSRNFFQDEELELSIDGQTTNLKFNGNNLWNTRQFILFLLPLPAGQHYLTLSPKHKPFLEEVRIYQLEELDLPLDIHSLTESRPEDTLLSTLISKARPWIVISSPRLFITKLVINALAKSGRSLLLLKTDDEDLQLRINGERKPNFEPKAHKYWYWCGRTLQGKDKSLSQDFTQENSIHLLELFSDRSPTVDQFTIAIKRFPTVDDPRWTGKFLDDPETILLARLIFGEAEDQPREAETWIAGSVLNRVAAKAWPNTLHEVILQPKQYDPFKPDDTNYPKVIDPLKGASERRSEAWRESYEVAKDILSGKIKNPTEATHFHGRGVSQEWFLRNVVPNGRFLRSIGDTYFYWSPN